MLRNSTERVVKVGRTKGRRMRSRVGFDVKETQTVLYSQNGQMINVSNMYIRNVSFNSHDTASDKNKGGYRGEEEVEITINFISVNGNTNCQRQIKEREVNALLDRYVETVKAGIGCNDTSSDI